MLARHVSPVRGFTLIELLITILIIGILAGIGLAAYTGQRTQTKRAQAITSVRNAFVAAQSYYATNDAYDGFNAAQLTAVEPTLTGTRASIAPGASASPGTIFYDFLGMDSSPIPGTDEATPAPAGTQRLRLCSASTGDRVYCIADNRTPGNEQRYRTYGTTLQNAIRGVTASAAGRTW
jgi:type IV pilus assembly protein PilE